MNIKTFLETYKVAEPRYSYSCYNATIKATTHDVYLTTGKIRLIKIDRTSGEVVEYYRAHETINGKSYVYVGYIPNIDEPIDGYTILPNVGVQKNSLKSGSITDTAVGNNLPPDFEEALVEFEGRGSILRWSRKPYGLIVEYTDNIESIPLLRI